MRFDIAVRQSYRAEMTVLTLQELSEQTPAGTPWLGLDLGEKTIGVAASDATRMIASPLASGLVIGLPLNMDGTEGPRAQSCRAFARNLERIRPVMVAFQDERLSTTAVERFLVEDLDLSRKRRAEVVDRNAAAFILQGALDRLGWTG
jgi:putative Holliday junction resolvase